MTRISQLASCRDVELNLHLHIALPTWPPIGKQVQNITKFKINSSHERSCVNLTLLQEKRLDMIVILLNMYCRPFSKTFPRTNVEKHFQMLKFHRLPLTVALSNHHMLYSLECTYASYLKVSKHFLKSFSRSHPKPRMKWKR